jgi:hypothetical protein
LQRRKNNTDSAKKPASLSAKVAGDGKTLIADKDNKIWLESNPETLSGVEGRQVRVKAFCGCGAKPN